MSPIYLDTNVLVQLVERREPSLRGFMTRVNKGGRFMVTSEITLVELLVKPLRLGDAGLVNTYEALLSPDGLVRTHPVDLAVLRRSAGLRAAFGGSLPDTIHVATAELIGCETIISSDERLKLPPRMVRIAVADLLDR